MSNLKLSISINAVYINGDPIIYKNSIIKRIIFETLLDQHWHDYKFGTPPDQYTFLTISEISNRIEKRNIPITDVEAQIRRPLNKLSHIIQSNKGYRLNPWLVLAK